jgi:hypothetical protein
MRLGDRGQGVTDANRTPEESMGSNRVVGSGISGSEFPEPTTEYSYSV